MAEAASTNNPKMEEVELEECERARLQQVTNQLYLPKSTNLHEAPTFAW